jgi:hypothetical protein
MNIGRNDPCPCGSGKKHKKCCLGMPGGKAGADDMQDSIAELRDKLESGQFSSIDEAQATVDSYMHRKNTAPCDEFHGLSPEQMYHFLHFPLESSPLIQIKDIDAQSIAAPGLALFSLLADAIGEKGLKPTAKGNLPQRFCREAALSFWGEDYERLIRYGSIRSEIDFFDLHCLRLVASLAGLVRKFKGKFILSVKCRKKLASHGVGGIYMDLFTASVQKFNWAYRDGYQEVLFVQQAFMFTLFLLSKYGDKPRPQSFYEDIFLKAFPKLAREIDEVPYQTVENTIRRAYFYRTLKDFSQFFGLADLRATSEDSFPKSYTVKKLPLLDQLVSFNI